MRHIIPATDFNPHEREARDAMPLTCRVGLIYFNPHEREARDAVSRGVHSYTAYFNPHEREARDPWDAPLSKCVDYFNPHEREARDRCGGKIDLHAASILIHTSVKLVTSSRNSNLRWQNSF